MATKSLYRGVAIGVVGLLVVAVPVTATAATKISATFAFNSAPGDYVGGGQVESYRTPSATITLDYGTRAGFQLSVSRGDEGWIADFAPRKGQELHIGTYRHAQRFPFQASGHPGLSIIGEGRGCNQDFGNFRIRALSINGAGNITEVAGTFVQHCESPTAPALTGSFSYRVKR
jgi:hypothetical protein